MVNNTLAAYAKANPGRWARRVKLCQWAVRATPRAHRDGKSPFEMATGLKPQAPLNRVFEKVSSSTLAPSEYIRDLCKHLEKVQTDVQFQLTADFAKKEHKGEKELAGDWIPAVVTPCLCAEPSLQPQQQKTVKLNPRMPGSVPEQYRADCSHGLMVNPTL